MKQNNDIFNQLTRQQTQINTQFKVQKLKLNRKQIFIRKHCERS